MKEDATPPLPLPLEIVKLIISHCNISGLLQLRLVSKEMKTSVDTSTRFQVVLEDIQINVHITKLKKIIKTIPSLPFSNFCIDVSPPYHADTPPDSVHTNGIYWDRDPQDIPYLYRDTRSLRKFIDLFCPKMRKLRVSVMYCCTLETELKLFQSLVNLRELHIDKLDCVSPKGKLIFHDVVGIQVGSPRLPFKKPNGRIKRLAVVEENQSGDYLIDLIKSCPSIEVLKVPRASWSHQVGIFGFGPDCNMRRNECYPYILRLGAEGHLHSLRQLDLSHNILRMDLCSQEDLKFFTEIVSKKMFRLENVNPLFLQRIEGNSQLSSEAKENFRNRIVSGVGMSQLLKKESFTSLQELTFHTSDCFPGQWTLNSGPIRQLPMIRKIKLSMSFSLAMTTMVQDFLNAVFRPDEPWWNVTEVDVEMFPDFMDPSPFPLDYLDTSLPNLTRLTFKSSLISKEELHQLIEVVSRKFLLEELCLITRNGIPATAFPGNESCGSPIFLRLKSLKKLRLDSNSNAMEKWQNVCEMMDDSMLELFSEMSLTHLDIYGGCWVNVTSEGIRKLVEGSLGRSVQWIRLEDVKGSLLNDKYHRETLERVCHGNRLAVGLTSSSFEQFKQCEKAFVGKKHPFRNRSWEYRRLLP